MTLHREIVIRIVLSLIYIPGYTPCQADETTITTKLLTPLDRPGRRRQTLTASQYCTVMFQVCKKNCQSDMIQYNCTILFFIDIYHQGQILQRRCTFNASLIVDTVSVAYSSMLCTASKSGSIACLSMPFLAQLRRPSSLS